MPKPWFFGISFSATAGSFTRWRILRATKSEISALASRSTRMSRKLPCQMPKPGSPYSFSQNASRSSCVTSRAERGSGLWMKQPGVSWQRAKISG